MVEAGGIIAPWIEETQPEDERTLVNGVIQNGSVTINAVSKHGTVDYEAEFESETVIVGKYKEGEQEGQVHLNVIAWLEFYRY